MSQPQHEDPFAEVRGHSVQVLAVAATVGEAAARWYAVRIQDKARDTERANATRDCADRAARAAADRADRATQAARERADREANAARDRADRKLVNQGLTDWLETASLDETVQLWRTATIHAASGDRRAQQAATRAHERLRSMNPPLMDAYDRHRATDLGQADAMRAAAYDLWNTSSTAPNARPHGNDTGHHALPPARKILTAGGPALDALDAAVRDEVGRLAQNISPEALDRLQREWRAAGRLPAAEAAQLLQQYAEDATRRGMMPPSAADALAQRGSKLQNDAGEHTENEPPHTQATPSRDADAEDGRVVQPVRHAPGLDSQSRPADQRLASEAAEEIRLTALVGATADDPVTARVDEHQGAQVSAQQHVDLAKADAAAAAHQHQLMRHAFPQLQGIGQLPPHVANKQPGNAATQRKPRTR